MHCTSVHCVQSTSRAHLRRSRAHTGSHAAHCWQSQCAAHEDTQGSQSVAHLNATSSFCSLHFHAGRSVLAQLCMTLIWPLSFMLPRGTKPPRERTSSAGAGRTVFWDPCSWARISTHNAANTSVTFMPHPVFNHAGRSAPWKPFTSPPSQSEQDTQRWVRT